jgi:hypothetical protein
MPKGRILMSAGGTPGGDEFRDLWFEDPEAVLTEIGNRNKARFVPGTLVFSPGGRTAEADFDTDAPGEAEEPTLLHQLAIDLDAIEARLVVPLELWRFYKRPPDQG